MICNVFQRTILFRKHAETLCWFQSWQQFFLDKRLRVYVHGNIFETRFSIITLTYQVEVEGEAVGA